MSLYGALFSGVSGLAAQSSAMGAIADNVSNINTIGYKGTEVSFQTLITKQISTTKYSPGGVQSRPQTSIDAQGLLSSTSAATDIAVSGQGLYVVNESANPGSGDLWGYTRAGSFRMDESGYLKNTGGFYLQAWPLMPHDGSTSASLVNVGDINYMKAYQDTSGTYTYINDNIIDSRNLRPVNFNTIGGTATPTKQIRLGANLPASDPIFDESEPEAGGRQALAVLVYDSLGNSHNINFQYTKESSNAWSLDSQMPEGAATMIVYDDRETTVDISDDVYSARGQLEFSKIPDNHTSIKITDDVGGGADEATYIFEFSTDGTTSTVPATGETVVMVDISTGVVSINDAMDHFHTAITANVPAGNRFTVVNNRIAVEQSITGSPLFFDTSSCLQC
ncbi:MAG: flagellar hook-basal body complex protein, partial [Alphaproteobacteria bacterium]|nr:flagellar hook-basal body complex protein [Alphaproteobacteria bacterium]